MAMGVERKKVSEKLLENKLYQSGYTGKSKKNYTEKNNVKLYYVKGTTQETLKKNT